MKGQDNEVWRALYLAPARTARESGSISREQWQHVTHVLSSRMAERERRENMHAREHGDVRARDATAGQHAADSPLRVRAFAWSWMSWLFGLVRACGLVCACAG